MSKPIIVGYDGSSASKLALGWAVEAASQRGLQLEIMVAWSAPGPTGGVGMGVASQSELAETLRHDADKMLAAAIEEARTLAGNRTHPLPVTGHCLSGAPAKTLVALSKDATMVVVGTHGKHGLSGMLLGSVSRQVMTHGKCPVVVVRTPADAHAKEVVVGVDGSPPSLAALDFAFDHASRAGLSLLVLHAWDVPTVLSPTAGPNFSTREVLTDFRGAETRTVHEVLAGHTERFPEVSVEDELVRGSAVQQLVKASETAALVVVGSRGHGGFVGLMLGSVSHGVGHHAKCPVAVVH